MKCFPVKLLSSGNIFLAVELPPSSLHYFQWKLSTSFCSNDPTCPSSLPFDCLRHGEDLARSAFGDFRNLLILHFTCSLSYWVPAEIAGNRRRAWPERKPKWFQWNDFLVKHHTFPVSSIRPLYQTNFFRDYFCVFLVLSGFRPRMLITRQLGLLRV